MNQPAAQAERGGIRLALGKRGTLTWRCGVCGAAEEAAGHECGDVSVRLLGDLFK